MGRVLGVAMAVTMVLITTTMDMTIASMTTSQCLAMAGILTAVQAPPRTSDEVPLAVEPVTMVISTRVAITLIFIMEEGLEIIAVKTFVEIILVSEDEGMAGIEIMAGQGKAGQRR